MRLSVLLLVTCLPVFLLVQISSMLLVIVIVSLCLKALHFSEYLFLLLTTFSALNSRDQVENYISEQTEAF